MNGPQVSQATEENSQGFPKFSHGVYDGFPIQHDDFAGDAHDQCTCPSGCWRLGELSRAVAEGSEDPPTDSNIWYPSMVFEPAKH